MHLFCLLFIFPVIHINNILVFKDSLYLLLQVNRVSSITSTITQPKAHLTFVKNERLRRLSFMTNAKMAVEGEVLEKESVSVDGQGGNSFDFLLKWI